MHFWYVLYLHGEILLKLALDTNQSINQSYTYMVTMEMRNEYLANFSWFNRTLHDLCLWPFSTIKQPHPVIWRYKYLLIIYERHVFPIGTFVKDMHSPAVHHWHICERHAFPRCSPFTHLSTKIIKYEVYRTEWDIFFAIVCSLLEWNQIYAGLVLLLVDIYIAVSKDGAG